MTLFILLLSFLFVSIVCQSTVDTLFIDGENGNDNNSGKTASTAWKTFSRLQNVTRTIQTSVCTNIYYFFVFETKFLVC
jgi:hypothetical protein